MLSAAFFKRYMKFNGIDFNLDWIREFSSEDEFVFANTYLHSKFTIDQLREIFKIATNDSRPIKEASTKDFNKERGR